MTNKKWEIDGKMPLHKKIEILYEKYAVQTWITHVREPDAKEPIKDAPTGGETMVELVDAKTGEPISYARSYCHPNDNYNKNIGAQIALGRAILHAYNHTD